MNATRLDHRPAAVIPERGIPPIGDGAEMSILLRSLLLLFIIVGGARAAGAPASRPTARGPDKASSFVVPMVRGGAGYFIRARVGENDAGWFLVDPAQPRILIDTQAVQRLKLPIARGSWGDANDLSSFAVRIDRMRLGQYESPPHLAIVTDLTRWRERYGVDLSGVLGWAALAQLSCSIDFRAATLTLFDPARFVPPKAPAVEWPIRIVQGMPATLGTIDGAYTGWFVIRPSCTAAFRVSASFVALHPDLFYGSARPAAALVAPGEEMVSRFESFQVMGGTSRSCLGQWQGAAHTSTMTRPAPSHIQAQVSGEVGGVVLRDLRVTIEREGQRMWVERLADEEPSATLARLGGARSADLAGVTPLMRAAELGRADLADAIIHAGADVNATDHLGRTALMAACRARSSPVVKLLLNRGEEANVKDANGQTALMQAAAGGAADLLAALIERGAEVEAADSGGLSAMHYAAASGNPRVIDLLADRRADVNRQARDGMTPLRAAIDFGGNAAVEALLRRKAAVGASPDVAAVPGDRTPLVEAAAFDRVEAARLLIDAGADVNAASSRKRTPLMWAAAFRAADMVRLLLASGAEPAARSSEGLTAMDFALDAGDLQCATLIYDAARRKGAGVEGARVAAHGFQVNARRGGVEFFMPVSIGGQDAGWMLLDTGAPGITVAPALAERFHLRTLRNDGKSAVAAGVIPAKVVETPAMTVGGLDVAPTLAHAENMGVFHSGGMGGRVTCVGLPFPDQRAFVVDWPAGKIELLSASDRLGTGADYPMRRLGNWFCIAMSCNGDRGYFVLDTGAPATAILFPPYLSLHPELFDAKARSFRNYSEWTGDGARSAFIDVGAAEGLGTRRASLRAQVLFTMPTSAYQTSPGLIGGEFLQRCRLTLDPASGRARAQWIPDGEPIGATIDRITAGAASDLFHTPALLQATYEGNAKVVRALIRRGADLNTADEGGTTPLLAACERGYEELASLLIDAGARADSSGAMGAAARSRLPEIVRRLLGSEKSRLTKGNLTDLLICAIEGGDPACVELALGAGADPNVPDRTGQLPLALCAASHGKAVTAVLLDHGADVNATRPDGRTALMLAAGQDSVEVVKLLLERRAKTDAQDKDGWTALMHAAAYAGPGVVRLLVDSGADLRLRNGTVRTALDIAAESDQFENAECLYFAPAAADERNKSP